MPEPVIGIQQVDILTPSLPNQLFHVNSHFLSLLDSPTKKGHCFIIPVVLFVSCLLGRVTVLVKTWVMCAWWSLRRVVCYLSRSVQ